MRFMSLNPLGGERWRIVDESESMLEVEQAVEEARKQLDTAEGRRELEQLLEDAKKTLEALRESARVDPRTLREPITM